MSSEGIERASTSDPNDCRNEAGRDAGHCPPGSPGVKAGLKGLRIIPNDGGRTVGATGSFTRARVGQAESGSR